MVGFVEQHGELPEVLAYFGVVEPVALCRGDLQFRDDSELVECLESAAGFPKTMGVVGEVHSECGDRCPSLSTIT